MLGAARRFGWLRHGRRAVGHLSSFDAPGQFTTTRTSSCSARITGIHPESDAWLRPTSVRHSVPRPSACCFRAASARCADLREFAKLLKTGGPDTIRTCDLCLRRASRFRSDSPGLQIVRWCGRRDSNPHPLTGSRFSYHFGFRRRQRRRSWSGLSLRPSSMAVGAARLVSTPSLTRAWLGIGLGRPLSFPRL
jgi:hypothetical protein